MGQEIIKKFAALRCDVMCECKSISTPLDSTRDFHNHDGHEILLVLNGIKGEILPVCMNMIFTGESWSRRRDMTVL